MAGPNPFTLFKKLSQRFITGDAPHISSDNSLLQGIKSIVRNHLVHDIVLVSPDQHGPQPGEVVVEIFFRHGKDALLRPGLVVSDPLLPFGKVFYVFFGIF